MDCTTWVGEVNEKLQTPQLMFAMKVYRKTNRYGAQPVARQAGGVPGPEPRPGPPSSTGGKTQGNRNVRPTPSKSRICSPDNSKDASKLLSGSKTTEEKSLPQSAEKEKDPLKIFQFNICGLSNKKFELSHVLHSKQIHVALLQETQHADSDNIEISGYSSYPCSCKGCQGAITYIRNDLVGTVENIDT